MAWPPLLLYLITFPHSLGSFFSFFESLALLLFFTFLIQKCHIRASAPKSSEHRAFKSVRATAERTWGDAAQGFLLLLCSSLETETRGHRVESQTPSEAAWLVLLKTGAAEKKQTPLQNHSEGAQTLPG